MDQDLRELQRYCNSNPGDLASGQHLFNHYLRLNDPVFLGIDEFINKDEEDFKPLFELFTKLPGESLWIWLAQIILRRTKSWCGYYTRITEKTLKQFPDPLARQRIQQLTKTIYFDFTHEFDSRARFIILYSNFNHVTRFELSLADINYSDMKDCFPKSFDHLHISGSLPTIQNFLNTIGSAQVRELELYSIRHAQSIPLILNPKMKERIEVLTFNGQHQYADRVLESLFNEPWPSLRKLSIRNACLPAQVLSNIVNSQFMPRLIELVSINNSLSQSPNELENSHCQSRVKLEEFFFWEHDLTVCQFNDWFSFLRSNKLKRICCIVEGGGNNIELKALFEKTRLLDLKEMHIEFQNIQGSLNYQWLANLTSSGLKKLDIAIDKDLPISEEEKSALKSLASGLQLSSQFPSLEMCTFSISQGWNSPAEL